MPLDLPPAIARYFAIDRQNAPAAAACFTQDAVVTDEARTHKGPAAIAAWLKAADDAYAHTSTPTALAWDGPAALVTTHVEGRFPGGQVTLVQRFTLANDRIQRLEIGL